MREFINRYLIPREKRPKLTQPTSANWNYFWKLGFETVKNLETEEGILASGKNELYGAIFGRDSLITSLKLLEVYRQTQVTDFLSIVRKVLTTLFEFQGKEVNIESGEEPGKCIHEYRTDNHEHLTARTEAAWYLYPDKIMRNYDSIDATPLLLIATYRYFQASSDLAFLTKNLPNVEKALNWIFVFADSNKDGFVDYQLHPERKAGGLQNQSWMDSVESSFHEDSSEVVYPLAPVEAQAYTYLALRLWAKYFLSQNPSLSKKLSAKAEKLKKRFAEKFVLSDEAGFYLAAGLDGRKRPLRAVRSSMGHCLWASLTSAVDDETDGILEKDFVGPIVSRLLREDMFEPEAGIRTLSSFSRCYNPNSYHNGSIWPHDNSMIAEGFENYGFLDEAALVREALLKAVYHFKTPVELFVYDKTYLDYFSAENGQTSCKTQAWSAAAILGAVSPQYASKGARAFSYRMNSLRASLLFQTLFKKRLGPWQHLSRFAIKGLSNRRIFPFSKAAKTN